PTRRSSDLTELPPSGQWEAGFSKVASSSSPGCWTFTMTRSSVTIGPQVSAATGTVRKQRVSPRFSPFSPTAYRPSLLSRALPSVEIHRLPWESKARLSGQEIGETLDLSKPPK